jgi:hypothetical protein
VLGERDRREWAGIEKDLAAEEASEFTAVSVAEMRPIISCLAGGGTKDERHR